MVAGDDARAENPTPANGTSDAGFVHVETREAHRDENGTRRTATGKSKLARNVGDTGAIETLLNFAEAARVLGISLRSFGDLSIAAE